MTKITCFSDIHGQQSKKLTRWFNENPGDILLFAGDMQRNSLDDGKAFLQWVSKLPYSFKVLIFGNHDCNHDYIMDEVKQYDDIIILEHEAINLLGIKIFGSPYSLPFMDWSFMLSEGELSAKYDEIPEDTDILITHTPAFGLLDEVEEKKHVGSVALRYRIHQLENLKVHVCGHIHEGHGIVRDSGVLHINASVLTATSALKNDPISFDYEV